LKSSSGNKSNLNVGACPNFSSSSALASTLASASASALILSLEDFFEDFLVRNFTNFSI